MVTIECYSRETTESFQIKKNAMSIRIIKNFDGKPHNVLFKFGEYDIIDFDPRNGKYIIELDDKVYLENLNFFEYL